MNASSSEPSVSNIQVQVSANAPPREVLNSRGGYGGIEAKDNLWAILHGCLAVLTQGIARWPPRYTIALSAVLALAYIATQALHREALGTVPTLAALAVALLIAALGVIALVKNETTEQRPKDPPQPRNDGGGPEAA